MYKAIRDFLTFERLTARLRPLYVIGFIFILMECLFYSGVSFIWSSILALTGVSLSLLWLRRKKQSAYSLQYLKQDLEQRIFGRRTLIVDSLLEAETIPDLGRRLSGVRYSLENHPAFLSWEEEDRARRKKRQMLHLGTGLVFLLTLGMQIIPSAQEWSRLREYLNTPLPDLPGIYLEGQTLALDLHILNRYADQVRVEAGGMSFTASNGMVRLPSDMTHTPSLEIRVYAAYRGLERLAVTKELFMLKEFLPLSVSMEVVYPFKKEEYASLQDIEVWKGARVILKGRMNHGIKGISFSAQGGITQSVDQDTFSVSFIPRTEGQYLLSLVSINTQQYSLPPFKVRIIPNQRPLLRLLYPLENITLTTYQWTIKSLLESEDDQGLRMLQVKVLVTNRDPSLNYPQTLSREISLDNQAYIRRIFELNSQDVEMLPGDVASLQFQVRDVLGMTSETVGFFVRSPDIWEMQERTQELQASLEKTTGDIKESLEKLESDVSHQNLSGAQQKAKDIQQKTREMDESLSELAQTVSPQQDDIKDISDSLKRMEDITRRLKEQAAALQDMQKFMQPEGTREIAQEKKSMENMLQEFEAMLDNLEFYKKYADLARQFELLRQDYDRMKEETEVKSFERQQKSFQKGLENMQKMDFKDLSELVQTLQKESKQLSAGNEKSFEKTDELMRRLDSEIKKKMKDAVQDRMQARKKDLERILAELFLEQTILGETRKLDPGSPEHRDPAVLARMVENINALITSLRDVQIRLETAVSGLLFKDLASFQAIRELLQRTEQTLDTAATGMRDNRIAEVQQGLGIAVNQVARLFLLVLQLDQALQDAMQDIAQSPQSTSMLSLEQLMQMQGNMTSSLEQLMRQLQAQGGMSPQMKEMMDQLARLQSEIAKNLGQAMQGEGKVMEGGKETMGLMDDIIKDLQSYKVETDTVEKSRQIEQKMLKAQKSLQSKGISDKRKAEQARSYQIQVPEALDLQNEKIDLENIKKQGLSDYYLRLIEKYRQLNQHTQEIEKKE